MTRVTSTDSETLPDAPDADAPRSSRWSQALWIVSVVLLIALFAGLLLRVNSQEHKDRVADALTLGKRPQAPALPSATLARSSTPGLPDWYRTRDDRQLANPERGRVLLVNFWASWCGPCDAEADDLQRIATEYAARGVTVIGLNSQDAASDARAFIRRHRITFPIVRGGPIDKDAWSVGGFPETFIVGIDGRISAHISGPIDPDTIDALLDDELAKRRPVTA